ncbi:MAG: DNA repair exonuclease [Burkholderiales bacterium]|nr:DNA repair exonuclease [Burkholderiales bacterium]
MGFRFIHAADIHLDSPLRGLSAYESAPADRLRSASREAFKELVTRAIEDDVSFLVLAGDLYDGDWRDYNTGLFFVAQMARLAKAGIRAFLLHGNHDAESEMTKKLVLPDNVTVFPSRSPHVFRIDDLQVALHGQSFAHRVVEDNLAAAYGARVNGHYNIGVLHTAMEGYVAHPNYAPCKVAELHAKGYDYWALGHVHEFQRWDGASTIVFPGNLQGRHVRETGRKGAVSVTVDDDGHTVVDRLFLDVLRWEVLTVDADGCATVDDVSRRVGQGLSRLIGADDTPRAVRVVLQGKTRLHGALMGNAAATRAQVLAQAVAVDADRLWIEKVKIATSPEFTIDGADETREALADLQSILFEAGEDADFLRELLGEIQPFLNKVSGDVRDDAPLLALAREGRLGDLVKQVAPALLAQLSAPGAP